MYYLLDKQMKPYQVTLDQVVINLDKMKSIKEDILPNGTKIQTVFTFFDVAKYEDKPFLFNTKVYVDNTSVYSEIYQTHKEAMNGHKLVLERYNEDI
jgi:hypothetical protein